jgi:hypothetical protein
MRIHTFGAESAPVVIMLPGSFCNADTMANIITRLEREFHILAVDYNGQYAGSEKSFTSRRGEAEEIIRYIQGHTISSVALVYGQSMGGSEIPAVPGKNASVPGTARTACGVDPRSGFSKLLRGSVHVPAFDESAG